jgi:hypothetical protein
MSQLLTCNCRHIAIKGSLKSKLAERIFISDSILVVDKDSSATIAILVERTVTKSCYQRKIDVVITYEINEEILI